jgi:hypothetical protein
MGHHDPPRRWSRCDDPHVRLLRHARSGRDRDRGPLPAARQPVWVFGIVGNAKLGAVVDGSLPLPSPLPRSASSRGSQPREHHVREHHVRLERVRAVQAAPARW